jgi:GTP cyclohydrolase I
MTGPDLAGAADHARQMLAALGIPCDTESTAGTPERYVRALAELTAGQHADPARHLQVTFAPPSDEPGLIVVTGVAFTSVCEHHLLPFTGRATVGYLPAPGARIVGLSKLARLVTELAARPQVQERLGDQVVTAIGKHLTSLGAGCVIRSTHACLALRGVRAAGAEMVTVHLRGALQQEGPFRTEFVSFG